MLFRQLFDRDSCTYTYLLADPNNRQAILIDPVFEHHERDAALLRELDLELLFTLDTHAHADHVTGAWLLKKSLGSKIVLSRHYDAEGVDLPIDHGDAITFGDYAVAVRSTPGHTHGCVSYVTRSEQLAFTGDCLLIRGAGRTDFQQGSANTMYRSIQEQIFTLPEDCYLYPAHDYSGRTVTTVREEMRFNARVGGEASVEDFVGYMNNLNLPHPRKIDIAVPANMRCGQPEDEHAHEPPPWGPVVMTYAGIPQIEPEWVLNHLDAVHILDVRSLEEYNGSELGHIEGAQHIPLDALPDRMDEVPTDKPVVPVCRSGKRSARATLMLRDKGFDQAANLAGGMIGVRATRK